VLESSTYATVMRVGKQMKQFTKFLVVGTSNAVVDLVVLNMLILLLPTHSVRALLLYNTIAVICAIYNSYIWNKRWTFARMSDGSRSERVRFLAQAAVNIALNDVVVGWLSTYLRVSRAVPWMVSSNAAKGLAMLLSSIASYFFMRLIVFRKSLGAAKKPNP